MSIAPEKVPSGGLFCIKNFTLEALYAENQYLRNIWTKSNNDLPLMRFCGAKIKCYRSLYVDYILSYGTSLPMGANLQIYQSMHPGIHGMIHHKIIVPRKNKNQYRKPYIKFYTKPPDPLINKWYFQQDMSKIPLLQIRASATSLDEYYVDFRAISTTINIFFLNTGCIQNSNFKILPTSGYYARKLGLEKIYLYSTTTKKPITTSTKYSEIIFLGNTLKNQPGVGMIQGETQTPLKNYTQDKWGNPFYWEILKGSYPILQSKMTVSTLQTKAQTEETIESVTGTYSFSLVQLTDEIRYNPMRDWGNNNKIYIYPLFQEGEGWDPPTDALYSQTISTNLPLWLLTFGYTDFMQRAHSFQRFDTDYIVVIQTTYDRNLTKNLVLISQSLIEGTSPNEDELNPLDEDRWYPSLQFQLEMLNEIVKCGPGTVKIPPDQTYQCQTKYTFYWKWGGNLPPMSSIQDPVHQPTYPIPNNVGQTIALQNPESNPEHILYNFDERRGMLTTKAIKRILKDEGFTKPFITDPESGHIPPVQTTSKETPEESSEEEETTQTLLDQLIKQRRKQQQLKQLILQHMKLTSLE